MIKHSVDTLSVVVAVLFLVGLLDLAECKSALFIVDVQQSFTSPNGSFPLDPDLTVVKKINDLRNSRFDVVVVGTLVNCANQISFASSAGVPPFTQQTLYYSSTNTACIPPGSSSSLPPCTDISTIIQQTLYPDYSITNTPGATLDLSLLTLPYDIFISRTSSCTIPFYSLFKDNLGTQTTALDSLLKSNSVDSIFITGFSYDTSIYYTAKDAKKLNYNVYIIQDATKAFLQSAVSIVNADLARAGISVIDSADIALVLKLLGSNVVKKSLLPYDYLDPLITWSGASSACYPNHLCSASDYCSITPTSSEPAYGYLPIGTWAPVYDGPNQWIYLGYAVPTPNPNILSSTPCDTLISSIGPFAPSIVQSNRGVPILCCGVPSTPPPPSPVPSPSPTPIGTKAPRIHVPSVDDQADYSAQVTRVTLIACLCLGLGIASGLAVGCFLGRKSVVSLPKII